MLSSVLKFLSSVFVARTWTQNSENSESSASIMAHPIPILEESLEKQHEVSDASVAGIAIVAVTFVVFGIVLHFLIGAAFHALKNHDEKRLKPRVADSILESRTPAPLPRLQILPGEDLQNYLNKEKEILTTYGWVDPSRGIVRVPIERAMEEIAHEK